MSSFSNNSDILIGDYQEHARNRRPSFLSNSEQTDIIQDNTKKQPNIFDKIQNIQKVYFKGQNNFYASLFIFPTTFFYALFQTTLSVAQQDIALSLKINVIHLKIVMHLENTICYAFIAVSNRFHNKYGVQQLHTIGGYLIWIMALAFYAMPNVVILYMTRLISGLAYGMSLPVYVPLTNFLSKSKNELTLTFNNCFGPTSGILAMSLAQYFSQKGNQLWRFIFLIGSILMVPYSIFCTAKLPFPKPNGNLQFDHIGIMLFSGSSVLYGVGVLLIQPFISYRHSQVHGYILIIMSIVVFMLFLIENKYSLNQVILQPVLNQNTILFVSQILFQANAAGLDSASDGTIWEKLFNFNTKSSQYIMHISKFVPFLITPIIYLNIAKTTIRWLSSMTAISLILFIALKTFAVRFAAPWYIILILDLINACIYIQEITLTQYYNVTSSPLQFGPISTSYVTFNVKLAWALSVMVQSPITRIAAHDKQILCYQCIAIFSAMIGLLLAKKIGIFNWEKGKYGYSDQKVFQFYTYDELYPKNKTSFRTKQMRRQKKYQNLEQFQHETQQYKKILAPK